MAGLRSTTRSRSRSVSAAESTPVEPSPRGAGVSSWGAPPIGAYPFAFEMTMMKTTFSRIATPVLFAATIALGACKQGDKPEDALAQDTSLAHDLSLANADTMSQPQLKAVPITTAPLVNPAAPAQRVKQRQTPSEILTPSRNPRRVVTTTTTQQPGDKAPVTEERK